MSEELDVLWSLHGLDEKLVAATSALGRYPGERATLERRLNEERGKLEAHKQAILVHQRNHREAEKDIAALEVEERKFAGQLPLVRKNEEYTALLREITDRKAKRSDRETELLVRMEEEQQLAGERPAIEIVLKALEGESAARLATIAAEEAREKDEAAVLEARRQDLMRKLGAVTRSRYERTRISRDGRAVVPIKKDACGGCFRSQPPQALQEARRGDRYLICDGCGRMLVWPPEGA